MLALNAKELSMLEKDPTRDAKTVRLLYIGLYLIGIISAFNGHWMMLVAMLSTHALVYGVAFLTIFGKHNYGENLAIFQKQYGKKIECIIFSLFVGLIIVNGVFIWG